MQLNGTSINSPIFDLPPDVLWRIFSHNAVMYPKSDDNSPALDTLRHTSQVCAVWRNLLLGSSSLWARVINLGYLEQSSEWRDEVMRRTGQAELDIMALRLVLLATKSFLSSFVSKHWSRIRSLHFKITLASTYPQSYVKNWYDIAQRPSSLRHLSLHVPGPTIAINFLESIALMRFPSLESLEIHEDFSFNDLGSIGSNSSFPTASLPHLRRIKITSTVQASDMLNFLEKIVPAKDCILDFDGSTFAPFIQKLAVDAIPGVLPKYLAYAMGVQGCSMGTIAEATFTNKSVRFSTLIIPTFSSQASSEPDVFCFHLWNDTNSMESELPGHAIPTFLSCLMSLPVQNIRTLLLEISPPRFLSEATNSAIEEFVLKLTSVESIQVDDITLIYLDNLQRQTTITILPALQNIQINRKAFQFVRGFLNLRSRMGVGMDTLTLTVMTDSMIDVSVLQGMTGLTVKIVSRERNFEQMVVVH